MKDINRLVSLLKEKRINMGYSLRKVEDILRTKGIVYTHSAIAKMESGRNESIDPVLLKELAEIYRLPTEELFKLAGYDNLIILNKKDIDKSGTVTNDHIGNYKLKVYNFDSEGDGIVNLSEYEEKEFLLTKKEGEEIATSGYVFKVIGSNMKPHFYEDDIIVFLKEEFQNWKVLDSNLIIVKSGKELILRKLFFDKGKAFLHSFNSKFYPEFELKKNDELIAVLSLQLNREVKKRIFSNNESQ